MFCKKCGKEIPDDSNLCSYCGEKIAEDLKDEKKQKMIPKKKGCMFGCLGVIVIFILLAVIGAISGNNHSVNGDKPAVSSQKNEKHAFKIGETFKSNAFEITIMGKDTAKRIHDNSGYWHSDANGIFLIVHVHYKNIADSAKSLDSSAFQLVANGKTYNPTILTIRLQDNIFHNQINPGIEKDGDVYFDIPEDVANSNLVLKLSSTFVSDNFNGEVELY